MKYLFGLLLLICQPAWAVGIVQNSGKQTVSNSSTNPTFTLSGVVSKDTIFVLVNYVDSSGSGTTLPTVSDGGGSYTADEQQKANNMSGNHTSAAIFSFFNAAAGTHNITLTRGSGATGVYWIYEVLEISGLPTTNSLDASSTTSYGQNTGPLVIGGSTLSAAHGLSLVLAVSAAANNTPVFYPPEIGMSGSGSSYNGLFTGSTDFPSGSAGYLIPSTTSTLGADFGGTTSSDAWAVVSAYYTPSPNSSFRHSPLGTRTGSRQAQ